ncbi:hypothetical protein Unana1_00551 [Umbelopsis nana]
MSILNQVFLAARQVQQHQAVIDIHIVRNQHALTEGALALSVLVAPHEALSKLFVTPDTFEPFVDNISRLWGAALLSTAVISLLCVGLPDVLPGKRNVGVGLLTYHLMAAIGFFHYRDTVGILQPGVSWIATIFHGVLGLAFYAHWNVTAGQVKQFGKQQKKTK